MSTKIQALRGMNDILPAETPIWRRFEQISADCLKQYGYEEIRLPLVETTELFKRSIGDITDIIEKEMYTFTDKNGESISLRPEGTAGCLRACLEHGLIYHKQQKLWYIGPMFRHERPQKGRYRQFHQLGVESFGYDGINIELELLLVCQRLWQKLQLHNHLRLQVNTLGTIAEREQYKEKLIAYLANRLHELDEDSKRRLNANPLRILDSKNPKMQPILVEAPLLWDSLGFESRKNFDNLLAGLDALNIEYTVNSLLVRGLDYYQHCVFEWVTEDLGSQGTVCAGGRYDLLVQQLGNISASAVGFGIGIERIILLLKKINKTIQQKINFSICCISLNIEFNNKCLAMAEEIRDNYPDWQVITICDPVNPKNLFKKADKSGADLALIIGEEEFRNNTISIKHLRAQKDQVSLSQTSLVTFLQQFL